MQRTFSHLRVIHKNRPELMSGLVNDYDFLQRSKVERLKIGNSKQARSVVFDRNIRESRTTVYVSAAENLYQLGAAAGGDLQITLTTFCQAIRLVCIEVVVDKKTPLRLSYQRWFTCCRLSSQP